MPPYNFQVISEPDIARGIDARSTEENIKPGYSEDLINIESNSDGFLNKRKGYQGYYGYIPVRVTSVEYTTTTAIKFTFDGSIDSGSTTEAPIVVYGKTSTTQDGDWTSTDGAQYYSTFTADIRDTMLASTTGTITKLETDHNISTDNMFIQVVTSDSSTDRDSSYFLADSLLVSKTSAYDVDINYTNSGSAQDIFVMLADKDASAGTTYVHNYTTASGTGSETESIVTATHNLNHYQIIAQHFYTNGSDWERFVPDEFTVNKTTGECIVTVSGLNAVACQTILTAAPIANVTTQTISASTTDTITISASDDFNYIAVYQDVSGVLTEVIPDSIVFDDSADTITITITNSDTSSVSYVVYREPVTITSSTVLITTANSATSTPYTDTNPQLTIWGLNHSGLYNSTAAAQAGHVTHIDRFKNPSEERLIVGLGGNLFSAKTRSEAGTDYLIPTTNASLQDRVGSDVTLAPLFETTAALTRTRGMVTDTSIVSNLATVTAVSQVSSTTADYTITFDSAQTLTNKIEVGDRLVVAGMGHGVWNGTFAFEGTITNDGTTEVTVRLTNTNAHTSNQDETGAFGTIGCFTDKITTNATTNLTTDDIMGSSAFSSVTSSVVSASSTTVFVDGITEEVTLTTGTALFATRTSNVIPVEATTNFVIGDMCTIGSYTRLFRVLSISAGTSITIDESISFSDASVPDAISVVGRWIPIEAPSTSDDAVSSTTQFYFDNNAYDAQPTIRSAMSSNNMYFTNNDDEVMKFDGTNIYQAGIARWQPGFAASLDTSTASIPLSGASATQNAAASAAVFQVTLGQEGQFSAGDIIVHSGDSAIYTVQSTSNNGTNGFIYVTDPISDTTTTNGTLKLTNRYRYYFKLSAVDANNNIIASAVTGADDNYFDLTAAGQINIRLIGMPNWGHLDHDALDLEVYRTARGTAAPFFKLATADVKFNTGDGYIDIVDSTTDDGLTTLDAVNTALVGAELGTAWEQPPRGKYITSIDNRLAIGNIKSYQEFDISILKADTATYTDDLDGKIFTFRKDSTNTSTTTNMTDVVRYQFVDGSTAGTITSITPNTAISKTSTTFTVTATHNLSAGDWVYMYHNAAGSNNSLTYAGWWQVSSVNSTVSFTVKANMNTAATANDVDRFIQCTAPEDIPVFTGTDGNYNQVSGNISVNPLTNIVLTKRLAAAINASMTLADITLSSPDQTDFVPWLTAHAGGEYGEGRMMVKQVTPSSTTLELVTPASTPNTNIYVHGISRSAGTEVSARTKLFPSRVAISYPNYPEIFNDPYNESGSTGVIDVNSADGQEITGIIPFFGETAFGASQVASVLVVFKTKSIYLVDVETQGIQKLESRGIGCTAPYSIASGKDGIIFANESGIYKLNRNQTITYVGRHIERIWQDDVNTDQVAIMTGHSYGVGRQYKLSVPRNSDTTNSYVMVYDYEREGRDQEYGAWSQYDNHPATGWANMGTDAFFCTTAGQVFSIRNEKDTTDYRDDASAITSTIITRAYDFGAPGDRKIIKGVNSHFQLRYGDMDGTTLDFQPDLDGTWTSMGTFTFTKGTKKSVTALSSLSKRRMQYIQLRYLNSTKDEDMRLSRIDFMVAGLPLQGIIQKEDTT